MTDPKSAKVVFTGGTSCQELTVGGSSTPVVEYIRGSDYGGGVGGILYTLRAGVPSYTHYNNRGDVVAKTAANGSLTYEAQYEAYGKRTAEQGATDDRQKANTKDEDPTGLLNEGFRYRDLETSTFITRDPLGFVDGPNMYAYVVQNPWTKFDPKGLKVNIKNKEERKKYKDWKKEEMGKKDNELRKEIISGLEKSARNFNFETADKVDLHTTARQKATEAKIASRASYQHGSTSMNEKFWEKNDQHIWVPKSKEKGAWKEALLDMEKNPSKYGLDCFKSNVAAIQRGTVEAGGDIKADESIPNENTPMPGVIKTRVDDENDWIPGDFAQIRNNNIPLPSSDTGGEFIMNTGNSGYTGLFGGDETQTMDMQKWKDKVTDWSTNSTKTPSTLQKYRYYPSAGLSP